MRENKTLAAIIGVMVAGGLGLAGVLVMAYSGYTASLEEYQSASSSVAGLKGAKLYPSAENVAAKEKAITEYEDEVSRLGAVLLALQQQTPVAPLSDTEFQAKLKSLIAKTRQAAEGKTALPKEFALGFGAYNTGLPRSGEAATELGGYLDAVDAIVNMIITSGITSIDSLDRTELAIEKPPVQAAPEPPKETPKAAPKKSRKGKQVAGKAAPPKEIAKVVERRTLTLTLTADQGPLQVVMNKLASPSEMLHFTVVRQLRVENEKQEGPLRGSLPKLGKAPVIEELAPLPPEPPPVDPANPKPAEPAAPAKAQVVEPAKPAYPDAQAVFGDEKLKVYLEIDLVRFIEPASAESSAAK